MLRHTPSIKAMKTYNEMPIDGDFEYADTLTGSDNTSFTLGKYDENSFARDSLEENDSKSYTNSGDYATVGTFSIPDSELIHNDHNEMGSTIKLISPKLNQVF